MKIQDKTSKYANQKPFFKKVSSKKLSEEDTEVSKLDYSTVTTPSPHARSLALAADNSSLSADLTSRRKRDYNVIKIKGSKANQ